MIFFPEIVNIERVFCPSMNQIKNKKLKKSWDFQGTSPNELYLKSVWKHVQTAFPLNSNFILLKINFLVYLRSFWCDDFKNNFLKNKKYYFNVFRYEKYFKITLESTPIMVYFTWK